MSESGLSATPLFHALAHRTPAQTQMLETLADLGKESTCQEIAGRLSVHVNSAREILEALVDEGLVSKRSRHGGGRGRPHTVYELAAPQGAQSFAGQMTSLLIATAQFIAHGPGNAQQHRQDAIRMGKLWAEQFLATHVQHSRSEEDIIEALSDTHRAEEELSRLRVLLSSQGFTATPGDNPLDITLRSCPYLVPDPLVQSIICRIHGAMINTVVATLTAGIVNTHLCPFVTSSSCELRLLPGAPSDNPPSHG